jgi:hypothetical protein
VRGNAGAKMIKLTSQFDHHNKKSTSFLPRLIIILMLIATPGCGLNPISPVVSSVDDVIAEIERTRQTIENESTGWRDELSKLVNTLTGMETVIAADTKEILASTTNQVRDLATQTIKLTDAKAKDLIGQTESAVFCTADFVKDGAVEQLQYIIDDLQFWKLNGRHLDRKPAHHVCVINPSVLHLYPSGNNWLVDTSNMSEANIVTVFGYNFWDTNMPYLELQDANDNRVRTVNLTADYVTHYQINLDFSNEFFPEVEAGGKIVFRWPDQPDPNTINLTLAVPAKIEFIGSPVFNPAEPTAGEDLVTLAVTITNVGGLRSGDITIEWRPDPQDIRVLSVTQAPMQPGESREVVFEPYIYQRADTIQSVLSITNGDATLRDFVTVLSKINPIQREEYVDRTTTDSTESGPEMRACPKGYAVAGIHVDNSEVLCRRVMPIGEEENVGTLTDSGTLRSNMHALSEPILEGSIEIGTCCCAVGTCADLPMQNGCRSSKIAVK